MFRDIKRENMIVYFFTVITALIIYYFLMSNIKITLIPHISALKILYSMQFEFIQDVGYREAGGLFIIGKSCMGAKLFVCLFIILIICRIDRYSSLIKKISRIPVFCVTALLLAYIITVFRIAASIPFCSMENFKLIHTGFSLIVYFFSGIGLYTFLNYKTEKNRNL